MNDRSENGGGTAQTSEDELHELRRRFDGVEISYHELAEFYPPARLQRYLDYGCGSLTFVHRVAERFSEGHGVDVLPEKSGALDEFRYVQIPIQGKLPYPDGYFDSVSLIEVIEHVPVETEVLAEIARVMRRDGVLIVTTPHNGLLTWVDPGNWKFYFPTLHRWAHTILLRNRAGFEKAFGQSRPEGLFGDVSGNRHKHYVVEEFLRLVPPALELQLVRISYPGMRLLWAIEILGRFLCAPRVRQRLFGWRGLRRRLSQRFSRNGDQLVLKFRRR